MKKIDILLLSPASDNERLQRNKYVMYAPLTLPMLASLTPPECKVTIIDEKVEEIDFGLTPDLVGITAITGTTNRSYEVAQRFRDKGCTVVLGGPHPTVMPDEALQCCNSVVLGQAYQTWPELLADFNNGQLKKIYQTSNRSLNGIPIPRRELLKRRKYITLNSVQATLGCPRRCDFCIVPNVFGADYHMRDVAEVIEELKLLKGRSMFFVDVNLTANAPYAKRLFKAMIPLKRKWGAQVTIEFTKDLELLDLAAQSGCIGVFIGIESLNQKNLQQASKNFYKVTEYEEMQRRLRDHGMCSMLGIVYGFDHDDRTIFDTTMKFMDRIKADSVRYGVLTPFPGTPLYQRLERENRIFEYNWDYYDSSHVVFKPNLMSPDELQEGFYRSMNHTYSFPSMLKRIFGSNAYLPVAIMVNYGYYQETRRLYRRFQHVKRNRTVNKDRTL